MTDFYEGNSTKMSQRYGFVSGCLKGMIKLLFYRSRPIYNVEKPRCNASLVIKFLF